MAKYLDDQGLNTLIDLIKPEIESAKSTATAASSKADSADTKADLAQSAVSETQRQVNSLQETVNGIQPDNFVKKSGDTMSGPLVLNGEPTEDNQAVTKNYVDSKIISSDGYNPTHVGSNNITFSALSDGFFTISKIGKSDYVSLDVPANGLCGYIAGIQGTGSASGPYNGLIMHQFTESLNGGISFYIAFSSFWYVRESAGLVNHTSNYVPLVYFPAPDENNICKVRFGVFIGSRTMSSDLILSIKFLYKS